MKNLKKYLAFFLVAVMVFSLCACTAKNEEPGNTDDKQSSVSTPADKDDNDNTVIISTADVSRTEPLKKHTSTAARSYTPKKSSSSDIDDIIKKSSPSKSKSISAMSVDDLLKVIEEEKKKL